MSSHTFNSFLRIAQVLQMRPLKFSKSKSTFTHKKKGMRNVVFLVCGQNANGQNMFWQKSPDKMPVRILSYHCTVFFIHINVKRALYGLLSISLVLSFSLTFYKIPFTLSL